MVRTAVNLGLECRLNPRTPSSCIGLNKTSAAVRAKVWIGA